MEYSVWGFETLKSYTLHAWYGMSIFQYVDQTLENVFVLFYGIKVSAFLYVLRFDLEKVARFLTFVVKVGILSR